MNPEELLDQLIDEMDIRGEVRPYNADKKITALLALAKTLLQIRKKTVPPELAVRMEAQVRAHIHHLPSHNGHVQTPSRSHIHINVQPFNLRRTWTSLLAAAALIILVCAGTLTAAAHSIPGDLLFHLKQAEYQFTQTMISAPYAHAENEIAQLQDSLADLSAVVNDGRDEGTVTQALNIVITKTNDSRTASATVAPDSDRMAIQHDLDTALTAEKRVLRSLLNHTQYWKIRLAFTQQIGALGDVIPSVTQGSVHVQNDGNFLLIVTGTNFSSHVVLMIKGQPKGIVRQSNEQQLIAVIKQTDWSHDIHTVGILNLDGMVAQGPLVSTDDTHPQQDGDDQNGHGTPGPANTPISGDDHSNHGSPAPTSTPTSGDDHEGHGSPEPTGSPTSGDGNKGHSG